MIDTAAAMPEPLPVRGEVIFEEGDFHALSESLSGDAQYNDRRLATRRKLLALGKAGVKGAKEQGCGLECRTSLHHPHTFNGMRVRRLWAYLTRAKAEKRRLRGILGPELGKDLDAAYRNAYLFLAIEAEALEVGLRIHPEGWYDGQNLLNRIKGEGVGPWMAELNTLDGEWHLQMHDWKGVWACGDLTPERVEEFLSYYTPGDHRLSVVRRWPLPPGARGPALTAEAASELVREALRLLPLYRFTAWSKESDHLFAG